MNKTIISILTALSLIIIIGTGIFIWTAKSDESDKFPDEIVDVLPSTSDTQPAHESENDEPVPEKSTWGQDNIDQLQDTLYGNSELTDEAELENVLAKYDSYELTWEGHNQWTDLDGKTYSAKLGDQSYTITVTYLETGIDIVETMDMMNISDEEPVMESEDVETDVESEQEVTKEEERPAWLSDKVETPNEITERVKTYTTRTKINWVIKHMMEDYGYSSVEVISYERIDDLGIWEAHVSFDGSTIYVVREDDGSNVYCSVGE